MADAVKKPLPYRMARAYKPKDAFGEPRVVLNAMPKTDKGIPIDGTYVKMGVIMGTIDGVKVSRRENNSGQYEYWYGLTGTFEAIPADPTTTNPVRTSVAWLPTHLQETFERMLKERVDHTTGETIENPNGADAIDFAFEIGITASGASSTGFTWTEKPLMETQAKSDPLAAIRSAIGPAGYLEGPSHIDEGDAEGDDPANGVEVGDQDAAEADAASHSGAAGATHEPPKGKARTGK